MINLLGPLIKYHGDDHGDHDHDHEGHCDDHDHEGHCDDHESRCPLSPTIFIVINLLGPLIVIIIIIMVVIMIIELSVVSL